ncbi:XRE family transcriptional regulator [Coprobacillus sp. AM28-15LB]|nr:XRE family transcriptional regulator [Coprobacillus sp. AM28-15LB]
MSYRRWNMRNRIKETRVAKKMTQGELASKSGLTRPYISKLENNEESVIKNTTMNSIANALGKSVSYIFFNDK